MAWVTKQDALSGYFLLEASVNASGMCLLDQAALQMRRITRRTSPNGVALAMCFSG